MIGIGTAEVPKDTIAASNRAFHDLRYALGQVVKEIDEVMKERPLGPSANIRSAAKGANEAVSDLPYDGFTTAKGRNLKFALLVFRLASRSAAAQGDHTRIKALAEAEALSEAFISFLDDIPAPT